MAEQVRPRCVHVDRAAGDVNKAGEIAHAYPIAMVACLIAALARRFEGVVGYIQAIREFISSGIVAAFLGGIVLTRAPAPAGKSALLPSPILYALFRNPGWILESRDGYVAPGSLLDYAYSFNTIAFLHLMATIFFILFAVIIVIAVMRPLGSPRPMPRSDSDARPCRDQYVHVRLLLAATVALYVFIW